MRPIVVAFMVVALAGCRAEEGGSSKPLELTFLRSETCPRSDDLYQNLLAALQARDIAEEPEIIDTQDLSADDPRTGYGVPTILVRGRDLFGADRPRPRGPT